MTRKGKSDIAIEQTVYSNTRYTVVDPDEAGNLVGPSVNHELSNNALSWSIVRWLASITRITKITRHGTIKAKTLFVITSVVLGRKDAGRIRVR